MSASSSSVSPAVAFTPLSSLVVGADVAVRVKVCRSWDVKNPSGKYIGTEYVLGDDSGNAVHCIARSSIAHCVVTKLHVGSIYSIRRFTLAPNKATYRLRQHDTHLINLESNTVITKLECSAEGFVCQPFVLQAFEEIAFNDYKFLIDVIGRPINVGSCKPTRNGSQFLEFDLLNERGNYVKATLWGSLGDQLLSLIRIEENFVVVVLPAMAVRAYKGGIQLSSTSGTLIYDSDTIPEIASMRALMRTANPVMQYTFGTLREILHLGREQVGSHNVDSVTLVCRAKIVGIRPMTPWNYYSCGEKGCKKGVKPQGTQFWCESCEKICEFPVVRLLLRLEVLDETTSLSVTVFDEIAELLVKKSAAALTAVMQGADADIEYPAEIISLIGTYQLFELKSHTYYNHGQYESFTVTRVLSSFEDKDGKDPTSGPIGNDPSLAPSENEVHFDAADVVGVNTIQVPAVAQVSQPATVIATLHDVTNELANGAAHGDVALAMGRDTTADSSPFTQVSNNNDNVFDDGKGLLKRKFDTVEDEAA